MKSHPLKNNLLQTEGPKKTAARQCAKERTEIGNQDNRLRFRVLYSKGFLLLFCLVLATPIDSTGLKNLGESIQRSIQQGMAAVKENTASINEKITNTPEPGTWMQIENPFFRYTTVQDTVSVALSQPGQPGRLTFKSIMGSLKVTGYDGDRVIIRYHGRAMESDSPSGAPDGLRRIDVPGSRFHAYEQNNVVDIRNASAADNLAFDILVPKNFSLDLSLIRGDTLQVEQVNGDIEINNVNGNITLLDVAGTAVLNTVQGDIHAVFHKVDKNKPMAFSAFSGNIDVTFPADTPFTARMKSIYGAVYTDFDVRINKDGTHSGDGKGFFSDSTREWIIADINGGGPEYRFQSLMGNVNIRKK